MSGLFAPICVAGEMGPFCAGGGRGATRKARDALRGDCENDGGMRRIGARRRFCGRLYQGGVGRGVAGGQLAAVRRRGRQGLGGVQGNSRPPCPGPPCSGPRTGLVHVLRSAVGPMASGGALRRVVPRAPRAAATSRRRWARWQNMCRRRASRWIRRRRPIICPLRSRPLAPRWRARAGGGAAAARAGADQGGRA